MKVFRLDFNYREYTSLDVVNGDDTLILSKIERNQCEGHSWQFPSNPIEIGKSPYGFNVAERNSRPQGDLAHISSGFFALGPRAIECLYDVLKNECIEIPCYSRDTEYRIFMPKYALDAVDRETSNILYWPRDGGVRQVIALQLKEEIIGKHQLFSLQGVFLGVLCTEQFVNSVITAGLTGFSFQRVYPPITKEEQREIDRMAYLDKLARKTNIKLPKRKS